MFGSAWTFIGLFLGIAAGVIATDLTREEGLLYNIKLNTKILEWHRFQWLLVLALAWIVFLAFAIWREYGADFIVSTTIGAIAAPWIWLHFVREYAQTSGLEKSDLKESIRARAYKIWLEKGQPTDQSKTHWLAAESEIQAGNQTGNREPTSLAAQQLARYQLVSILLGVALLAVYLEPVVRKWANQAQQFQAFGMSLTMLTHHPEEGGGREVLTGGAANPRPAGGDQLLSALEHAYEVGGSGQLNRKKREPDRVTKLDDSDVLSNFDYLPMVERDRAYIAWLAYERLGDRGRTRHSSSSTLRKYIEDGEAILLDFPAAPKIDPTLDYEFVKNSSPITTCLYNYAVKVRDPLRFSPSIYRLLTSFGAAVDLTDRKDTRNAARESRSAESFPHEVLIEEQDCPAKLSKAISDGKLTSTENSSSSSFNTTPYPRIVLSNYEAAIGAVDTAVGIMDEWINKMRPPEHRDSLSNHGPKLGWYLVRAERTAINLPYFFGGMPPSHRHIIASTHQETDDFGALLHIHDGASWKSLCNHILSSSVHGIIGRRLALYYATERFYFFENLFPEDFDSSGGTLLPEPPTTFLKEAEAIRDDQSCLNGVPTYDNYRAEYRSYFALYTAQLGLAVLKQENRADERKDLEKQIESDLKTTNHFGPRRSRNLGFLEDTNDAVDAVWDQHRLRLAVLQQQLATEKRKDDTQ